MVNEYGTGAVGAEGCPVVRLQAREYAEDREGGAIATADVVLVPLLLMSQLPQVRHTLLGECLPTPGVDEYHDDIRTRRLRGVSLDGMQWIDQVATFALVNLHDVALKTHILQQVAGRQREVPRVLTFFCEAKNARPVAGKLKLGKYKIKKLTRGELLYFVRPSPSRIELLLSG